MQTSNQEARSTAHHEGARLFALFQQAPVALAVLRGPQYVVELANPLALRVWGQADAGELLGRPLFEALPELAGQGFAALLDGVRTTGKPQVGREVLVPFPQPGSAPPEYHYLDFVYERLSSVDGDSAAAIFIVGTDVTESVRLRQRSSERADAERHRNEALLGELHQVDQRKDEFLATLAHELRNPMAAISMALSLLESTGNDVARGARYREMARRQMGNMVRMVDDLLDVARINRGRVELRRMMVDATAVLKGALDAVRPLIEQRQHALTLTVAPGCYRVDADTRRLEQVFVNLIQNAAKFTDVGGQLSVRLSHETSAKGSQLVLCIRDNGRGIPPEMLDKIYDPFTQISPTSDRSAGGIGLGLTLVKRLVELHGGSVMAHSDGPGQGSEFVVRLPLAVSPATAPAPASARPAQRGLRVVIAEDSEDARELLTEVLELSGCQVFIARDGAEAVKQIRELRPDAALVDVGLPIFDGYEVARRVRSELAGAPLYLIALTGYDGDEAKARAADAGFDLHLTKPVDINTFATLFSRVPRA